VVLRTSFLRRRKWFRFGLLLVLGLLASDVLAQEIRLESKVKVSPPTGGWYPWYEMEADPSDPNNLIACGSRWDVKDNAFYGFVYSSSDGGNTWRTALEDRNSTWVSEQSCAFGVNGRAYFVSEAAHIIDGKPSMDDLGVTRVFVSNDAGRTWAEAAKTHWADYSTSVVDTRPGPDQNRLYSFFNYLPLNTGDAIKDLENGNGERVALITYKDGDESIGGPIVSLNMGGLRYQGSFPDKAFLLKDGSLMSLYLASRKTEVGRERILGAVRTNRNRSAIFPRMVVHRWTAAQDEGGCPFRYAAAYNPSEDRIYVVYRAPQDQECRFWLTTSADGGKTWSTAEGIRQPRTMSHNFDSPAMSFNREGTLGLIWREGPVSDCWYFSASWDEGKTFNPPEPLSQCLDERTAPLTESSASLRVAGSVMSASDRSAPVSADRRAVQVLTVIDSRNHAWRNISSLTATSDGVFHPLWIEIGNGEGQLRTAAVIARLSRLKQSPPAPLQEKDACDISRDVVLLPGGAQHYDISSGTLSVDIVLKSKSEEAITPHVVIKVLKLSSQLGRLEIANADNGASGAGAVWDLSKVLPDGVLRPGATSEPFPLLFRVSNNDAPQGELVVVSMQFQVLASADWPKSN
jgi:hypothetical protein